MKTFLQSKEWFDFQKSLGREVFFYNQGGVEAGIIKLPLPFKKNYLYIPHGPKMDFNQMIGGIDNEVRNFLQYLKNLAKKEKAIFIKAEPLNDSVAQFLAKNKFKKSKKEIQPHKTIILDLLKSEEEILETMHYKTRYNIKVAEKHNILVQSSSDLDIFWKLVKKTTERQKFSAHTKDYYKSLFNFFNNKEGAIRTSLYLALFDGKPVAGALMLTHGDVAYYLHGGSDYEFREVMAPHILHWFLIREMKKQGFKYYDFGGSEGTKWPGLTRFKLGWGGRTVEYPGSFDLTTSWWWHQAYKLSRKIFNKY